MIWKNLEYLYSKIALPKHIEILHIRILNFVDRAKGSYANAKIFKNLLFLLTKGYWFSHFIPNNGCLMWVSLPFHPYFRRNIFLSENVDSVSENTTWLSEEDRYFRKNNLNLRKAKFRF